MSVINKQNQMSDLMLLSCLLSQMIEDGDEAVATGTNGMVVLLGELALVICDVARSQHTGEPVTPASLEILCSLKADHAFIRAKQDD